jgi:hypothetical protein
MTSCFLGRLWSFLTNHLFNRIFPQHLQSVKLCERYWSCKDKQMEFCPQIAHRVWEADKVTEAVRRGCRAVGTSVWHTAMAHCSCLSSLARETCWLYSCSLRMCLRGLPGQCHPSIHPSIRPDSEDRAYFPSSRDGNKTSLVC